MQIQPESVEGVGRGDPRDGVQLEDGGAPRRLRDQQQRGRGDERAGQVGVSGATYGVDISLTHLGLFSQYSVSG